MLSNGFWIYFWNNQGNVIMHTVEAGIIYHNSSCTYGAGSKLSREFAACRSQYKLNALKAVMGKFFDCNIFSLEL